MRPEVRHVIMKRMKNDYRDSYNDHNYDERDSRRDYDDFDDDMRMHDSADRRRGRPRRRRDYDDDMYDDEYDRPLRLPRKVRHKWLQSLKDKDGNVGPHFSKEEVMEVADKMNLDYDDYSPSDVYLMANVLYSDMTVFHPLMSKDKSVYYWVAAAQEWLEDHDASLTGSDRVVSYYYNIARG